MMTLVRPFTGLPRACVVLLFIAVNCYGRTIQELSGSSPDNLQLALNYLQKYEYVSEKMDSQRVSNLVDPTEFERTIRLMQRYMPGVNETGVLDDATIAMLDSPRCGVPDPSGDTDSAIGGRLSRFTHTGGRWEQQRLTYRITNTAEELSLDQVRTVVRRAFDVWQTYIPREFVEVSSGQADIILSFGEYHHGDQYPFDGPSGTLAHAFGPYGFGDPIEGDVHFDDAEYFTVGTPEGINLFLVAAHEIGHSLGLGHSTDNRALMAPFYSHYMPDFRLPYDDIRGIQTLYGSRPNDPGAKPTTPTTTTKEMTTELPLICKMSFDSVSLIRGEIFAFKGDRFWRVRNPGEPLSPPEGYITRTFFKDLPDGIQAAYERYYDNKILFFKGKEYWVYDGVDPLPGYPRLISNISQSTPLPGNIQAAVTYGEYNKVYFFKRGKVYRYDEFTKKVDDGWPYPISSVFPGVPKGLHAGFRYVDGLTYFIKGKYYYPYSDTLGKVIESEPQPFVADFFGCNPNLYNFMGVNQTDYDAYGMNDDNAAGSLHAVVALNTLLLLISAILVSN